MKKTLCALALFLAAGGSGFAQDPLQEANKTLKENTGDRFWFTFEERTRWEEKDGVNFGSAVNQQDMLSRIRIGAEYDPFDWLEFSAMGQDARAPFYGNNAPNTLRDTMDLQEAHIDIRGRAKEGVGFTFGREMISYGEGRIIGIPDWTNVSRTYDNARMRYRREHMQFEVLMLSPVKVLPDSFNVPDLGERIWGTYNTLSKVWHGASFDLYALRHSQNRIGGWTGKGTLGTDSYGGRFYGPLAHGFDYSMEGIGQTGHSGFESQRAYAGYSNLSKKVTAFKRTLTLSGEYKVASGTHRGESHSSTFDQISPANHDKYGFEDLFGWRNLRNVRALSSYNLTKAFALNLEYDNNWLDSASDSLYNSSGKSLAVSSKGTAGTHVGQELDSFATYKYGAHLFGAGFGHFFEGEFVERTTHGINPRYFYVFQQYSFK
jgi:hypothetical protein